MTLRSRSIQIDPDKCRGHMGCMRVCPAEAIRVWRGKAQLLRGRCIDCGLCMRVCEAEAITPRQESFTDFHRFRHTVGIPSPALFAQFGRTVAPGQILEALERAGFNEVVDTTGACEAALLTLQRMVREDTERRPLISPFCPTVVRLIQVRYPNLAELIAPIESPQEVLAATIREERSQVLGLRRDEIGVIYITPCLAKMVGLQIHTRRQTSHLDGAVAISHIYGPLSAALASPTPSSKGTGHNGVSGGGLGWALLGGQGASIDLDNALAVGGLENVMRILSDIEDGKMRDIDYVECRACRDGCVDGCLTIDNPYEAHSKLAQMVRDLGTDLRESDPRVSELCSRTDLFETKPVEPRPQRTLDADMAKAIEKMSRLEEILARLPQIDCGACGAPTCRVFAEDVAQGLLEEEDCVFLLQGRLKQTMAEISGILEKLPSARGEEEQP